MSIGAVLAELRADFPDVTISKIRFLEAEGLVRPGRAASGYRQFGSRDVERLRFVLSAQRDHYLPLKVIKEQLERADARSDPADRETKPRSAVCSAGGDSVPGVPKPQDFVVGPEIRMTREDLLAEVGIDGAMLTALEQYGLVRPGAAGFYNPDAVAVARTVRALTEYGIEPRHLRAFRSSADREIGLLEQIVAPMYQHRDPDRRAVADETARELASLSVTLHTLLVKVGLRGVTGS